MEFFTFMYNGKLLFFFLSMKLSIWWSQQRQGFVLLSLYIRLEVWLLVVCSWYSENFHNWRNYYYELLLFREIKGEWIISFSDIGERYLSFAYQLFTERCHKTNMWSLLFKVKCNTLLIKTVITQGVCSFFFTFQYFTTVVAGLSSLDINFELWDKMPFYLTAMIIMIR